MYTARNIRTCIAIAFWLVYVSAAPLVSGASLSGQWRLEAELIHHSGHKIVQLYDGLGNITEYREDIVDPDPPIHFGGYGPVVHSDGKIEGIITREVTCGEIPQVTCTGSVSEDNWVEFTCTIPGASGLCDLDGSSHYWLQTDWVGSFEGLYDPTKRIITGTFEASQDRDCDVFWGDGNYFREERTHKLQSGTFSITICCSCDVRPWPNGLARFRGGPNTDHGTVFYHKEAESGERIEVRWVGHLELLYWRPGGPQGLCAGQCHWIDGCNAFSIFGPDLNDNDKPDCFSSIQWLSWDFGEDDNHNNRLDVIRYSYAPCLGFDNVDILELEFDYDDACDPPISAKPRTCEPLCEPLHGQLKSVKVVSLPLGSETEAFFDELLTDLQGVDPNTVVMGLSQLELRDMDRDGDFDREDCRIINLALGKCWVEQGYFPFADVNADGCVTTSDIELMLGPRHPDVNGDGVVNLTDLAMFAAHWSPGAQGDWCGIGDFDTSCAVDFADLLVLADHWLEESP